MSARHPTVLTIAGSDSSGGAGIQADLKAFAACGAYGASVVVAVTAQNTQGVRSAETVSLTLVRAQLDAVFEDLRIVAVKTGMLATADVVRVVAERLRHHGAPPLVCDPVMVAKGGDRLLADDAVDALRLELLPLATVVTPNRHEAEVLSGIEIDDVPAAERAARRILEDGPAAVLVKGGHLGGPRAVDVLVSDRGVRLFEAERLDRRHTHGTGCTYAAAIAAGLGEGLPLEDAVAGAKRLVTEAIRHGLAVGHGVGPTDPLFALRAARAR